MIKYYSQDKSDQDILTDLIKIECNQIIGGTTILQIGARPGGGWRRMFERFRNIGYKYFDILEVFQKNYNEIQDNIIRNKFLGNAKKISSIIKEKYDIIIWWHGPQQISKKDFAFVMRQMSSMVNIAIIVACPHGRHDKPVEYGNPYEEHISHWSPEDLQSMGFDVFPIGNPNNKKSMVGIYKVHKTAKKIFIPEQKVPKVIAITQCYNEIDFIRPCIEAIQPYADHVIITESCNSPYLDKCGWNIHSTDGTHEEIEKLEKEYENVHYAKADNISSIAYNRTNGQGLSKKIMFDYGERHNILQDDDWIWIVDADEFYSDLWAHNIVHLLKTKYKNYECGRITEWQFAYGTAYMFLSSHGRFVKYKCGSSIKHVHKLIWPNGHCPWKGRAFNMDVQEAIMFHLSYTKHPERIRQKMLSFNRPHYTYWFNKVYLEFPVDEQSAYKNNKYTPSYPGIGWHWGSNSPLILFDKKCNIDPCKTFEQLDWISDGSVYDIPEIT